MTGKQKISLFITAFLKSISKDGLSESTIKTKERHLSEFEKWLTLKKISEPESITDKEIISYKNFVENKKGRNGKKISATTKKDYYRTVAQFLNFLKKCNIECASSEIICTTDKEESDLQKLINYYFRTKGVNIEKLQEDIKKKKIIYSRYTKPAKDLLQLAESLDEAKKAIEKVSDWAKSRNLDYAIETVVKKWPEMSSLEPKKKEKQPFYRNDRMVKSRDKWYVIDKQGQWFEFAGDEKEIEWREEE